MKTRSRKDWYHGNFENFHAMYKAQEYKLVLVAKLVDNGFLQELEQALAVEQEMGGLPSRIEVLHIPGVTDEIKYAVGPISPFSFETC